MTFALVLAITAILSIALADVIHRVPGLFYALATVLVLALIFGVYDVGWQKPLTLLVRRCLVALALFTVVMYVGVLPKDSRLGMRLRPIRAELSIIACILCMGHMCIYLAPYAARALSSSLPINIVTSLSVAIVLFALLLVLGVTSFGVVKRHMNGRTWKRVQMLAYPFFLLIYVHLMLMLAPAAVTGATSAVVGIVVYSVLMFAYVGLRLWRFAVDSRNEGDSRSVDESKDADEPMLVDFVEAIA